MITQTRARSSLGQVLVAVVLALTVLLILIPVILFKTTRESVWTVKESRNTTAFQLAEAGEEKAYLTIFTSSAALAQIQGGSDISGLMFDVSYTDISGGTYTIFASSGPTSQQITIVSVGRDSLNRELRGLKTIYGGAGASSIQAPVYANMITVSGSNANVEWGPVVSQGTITNSAAGAYLCYPQLWAGGGISSVNRCTTCIPAYAGDIRCIAGWNAPVSHSPCTDTNVSWWAYNCNPGIPPSPTIDFAHYKALAQADHCTELGTPGGAVPANSCYWPVGISPNISTSLYNSVTKSSHTYYADGSAFSVSASGACLQGALIVPTGNINFGGSAGAACGPYTIPDAWTPGGIPVDAWKQYRLIDTLSAGEYYGDAALQQVETAPPISGTFTFGLSTCTTLQKQTCIQQATTFRGLVYVGGNIAASGSNFLLHGVLVAPPGVGSLSASNVEIFYDDTYATQAVTHGANQATRIWWGDVVYSSWPGP